MEVLQQYSKVVQVIPWALPGHLPNDAEQRWHYLQDETWQRRRLEVLPYNHCLYDNLGRFKFIVPLDIDEIIFPVEDSNWSALLERVLYKQHGLLDSVASFAVQNTYFFSHWDLATMERKERFPSLIESKFRTANFSALGHGVKSFVNTRVARSLFNHYALSKFEKVENNFLRSIATL